jgi:hypothetical protein
MCFCGGRKAEDKGRCGVFGWKAEGLSLTERQRQRDACVRGLEFTLLCYCSDLSSIVVVMKEGE